MRMAYVSDVVQGKYQMHPRVSGVCGFYKGVNRNGDAYCAVYPGCPLMTAHRIALRGESCETATCVMSLSQQEALRVAPLKRG